MSVFVRASCGCVVLRLGRPVIGSPGSESVIGLWSCASSVGDPYGFNPATFQSAELERGRPLTGDEEDALVLQLQKRLAAGTQLQCILGAVLVGQVLNQGRTDASPAPQQETR